MLYLLRCSWYVLFGVCLSIQIKASEMSAKTLESRAKPLEGFDDRPLFDDLCMYEL